MISSTAGDLSCNIANLCRICSTPGSHSIFVKIPAYLHEHPRECARWTMPIHRLVTEVTGLDITVDDGLPQKICVLCISYLKHAYTFRRQTIDNVAALLAAKYLLGVQEQRKESKNMDDMEEIIPTMVAPAVIRANVNVASYKMMNLGGVRGRKSVPYQKNLDKEVLQQVLGGSVQQKKKQNNAEEERRRIEEAFLSRWQDSSPEDNATGSASGFFSYTEKEFQEDDVMELDVLKEHNITFNLPEDYKEKKCPSCRKRFMFDESYNEHLKECLLFKLVKFIREVYHFLFLKENRSISSFEFIRRVVFSVKKTVEVISSYGEESTEPESEVATTSTAQTADDDQSKIERSFLTNLEKLRVSYNPEGTIIPSPIALMQQSDDGRSSFTTGSTSISPVVAVTRCEECHATFESVTELEVHNLNYHRQPLTTAATPNNLKRLAPFPQPPMPPSPKEVDMIKNRLLSRTPDSNSGGQAESESDDQRKAISCKKCKRRFYTISQLDNHQIRSCQRKSPRRLPESRDSPADRSRKNLNASYFYTMELLKEMK
ncbi:uncharacterized protein LOC135710700 [Ochlerotatus camptorhynchus]|uniref:uncharacterized protein LOC135710700 n=1 Tax=Ochlerotatus camptorhynchus TaxID=644619 RepID=UPI0031D78D0C